MDVIAHYDLLVDENIDEDIKLEKDFINHPNSAFDKGMEFRSKRDLKLKLIDVINE